MDNLNYLFARLEEISKDGPSVVIKIDGERWREPAPTPYTVMIFGGEFVGDNVFRSDSEDLEGAIVAGIEFYEKKSVESKS